MIKKWLAFVAIIAAMSITVWAAGTAVHDNTPITMSITTAGDTAQITTRIPKVAVDSFLYSDTFSYHADTAAHKTITWLSPLQAMLLTPSTTVDTTLTYTCSVAFAGGETLGIAYACIEDTSLTLLVDSLTANINAETNLTDSVDAQDSGVYIKIVSLFSEVTFGGNWSTVLGDSLDTVSITTTKAMICDSMVAAINANAGLDSFLTAAVTATDTTFTITSDDAGVLFWDSSLNDPDTYSTVTRTQANVTSWSRVTDTVTLVATFPTDEKQYNGIYGTFIVQPSATTTQGIGGSDSCYIRLLSGRYQAGSLVTFIVDADSAAGLPCTLFVSHPAQAGSDTLLKEMLYLYYDIADTASDTTATIYYPLKKDYILFEK